MVFVHCTMSDEVFLFEPSFMKISVTVYRADMIFKLITLKGHNFVKT